MHILNSQEIFDAALNRMMTDGDKHIITPEKRPVEAPPEPPIIHQPVLVKAPSQHVTLDGAYITELRYTIDHHRPTYHSGRNSIPLAWLQGSVETRVDISLLLLGSPNQFLAAARAGKVVRLVFSE